MTPILTLITLVIYLALLFVVARATSRSADNKNFFTGGRRTPAWVVALAMVGAPMTGVTFISVPGMVAQSSFAYLQMVLGFIVGSVVIAYLLIPLYYKHKVTSLYEYLDSRFGLCSHRCGAWLFLLSKLLGTALKTLVACMVVQQLLCNYLGIPFWLTAVVFVLLVWLYTYRGGVGSVVWIDAIKTICMATCAVLCIVFVLRELGLSPTEAVSAASDRVLSQILFVESWSDNRHFAKMFLAGVFMIVAMTGLDQDMMQRALSSRSQKAAQQNIILASLLQTVIITLLLSLGAIFYLYLADVGRVVERGDEVFAFVATQEGMPAIISILLVLGVMAATFSATGGALTSLTTSFMVDILQKSGGSATLRKAIHFATAMALVVLILAFNQWGNDSTINLVYRVAGYTYGPLLGMFAFGIFTKRRTYDKLVPLVAIIALLICLVLDYNSEGWFDGYEFGFEILLLNATITIGGLYCISRK